MAKHGNTKAAAPRNTAGRRVRRASKQAGRSGAKRFSGSSVRAGERAFTVRALLLILAVVLAFVAGFAVRGQTALLSKLGFDVEASEAGLSGSLAPTKSTFESVAMRLSEGEDVLAENSMDSWDIDEATAGVFDSITEASGDKYLTYFDPDRYSAYVRESTEGAYAGIGALFSEYEGRAYVIDVFDGSVAAANGIQQGDFVIGIDGDDSHPWSMSEVVAALSRNGGDRVVVTWMRPTSLEAETGEEFTTTLECSEYVVENVSSQLLDSVGYIQLRQITQKSAELVSSAVKELETAGATSLVLDIRDNPGGYLTQAVNIASLFVKSGVLVEIETNEGITNKTASGKVVTTLPLVVLVNEHTSAAAEVLAAALQDNARATVVGKTTFGKGSVQVMRELSFGGAIRYTAAYYRTPLGHDINYVGIIPDISIGLSSEESLDTQKSLALETAQSLVQE
ncbi:MAG: PDZ domain-containing protein [Eggerthellaceae bacterium]|nr:PDZ domain-containing protein [Eggerthellaceae bacterium]